MKLKPVFLLLILALVLCLSGVQIRKVYGAPSIVSLTLFEDCLVYDFKPNTNYGAGDHISALNTTTGPKEMYGYVKFNLSQIPAAVIIQSAIFFAYTYLAPSGGYRDVSAKAVTNQTWLEENITWNDCPTVINAPVIDVDGTDALGWWDWNVTLWVQQQYGASKENVSMCVVNNDATGAGWFGSYFSSKERAGATPPMLNITYSTDFVSPCYRYPFGLNSTLNGSVCQFTVNFTDNVGLSVGLLSWNNSGSWTNISYSLSGNVDLALWNQTLNSTSGLRIEYLFYVNDTLDNWNQTVQHFIYTNTKPIVLVISDASVLFIGFLIVFALCGCVFILGRRKT